MIRILPIVPTPPIFPPSRRMNARQTRRPSRARKPRRCLRIESLQKRELLAADTFLPTVVEGGGLESFLLGLDQIPSDPSSIVVINVTVDAAAESRLTLSQTRFEFDSSNFTLSQTLIVSAIDNDIVDGDITALLTFSYDPISATEYSGRSPITEELCVIDDDISTGGGNAIAGLVFVDANADTMRQSGEVGAAGITVYSDVNANGRFDRDVDPFAVSDAGGLYSILGIPSGRFAVRTVSANGFLRLGEFFQPDLSSEEIVVNATIPLLPLAQVTGTAFDDHDGDGVRSAGEAILFGQSVTLRDADGESIASAVTNSRGVYVFDNVLPTGLDLDVPGVDPLITPTGYEISFDRTDVELSTPVTGLFAQPREYLTGVQLPFDANAATPAQLRQFVAFQERGEVPASWPKGILSGELTVADFNDDGLPDVAVANEASDLAQALTTVTVLLNSGGDYEIFQEILVRETGPRLTSIDSGDLDGDGNVDLAFSALGRREQQDRGTGNSVSALFNRGFNGSGQWLGFDTNAQRFLQGRAPMPSDDQLARLEQTGQASFLNELDPDRADGPTVIAIGDTLGIGQPQIVSANMFSNNLSYIIPDTAVPENSIDFTLRLDLIDPTNVLLSDIDGDGLDDYVVISSDGNLEILLTATQPGEDRPRLHFDAGRLLDSSRRPRALMDVDAVDFDGDGIKELVLVAWPNKSIERDELDVPADDASSTVLLIDVNDVTPAGGLGTIQLTTFEQFFLDAGRPVGVTTGDLNGSSRTPASTAFNTAADIAVIDQASGRLDVLLHWAGGVRPGGSFPTADPGSGFRNPINVELADVDGDGRQDALVSHLTRGFTVLINQGARHQFTVPLGLNRLDDLDFGVTNLPAGTGGPSGPGGEPLTNLANPFDVDADGNVSAVDALRVINWVNAASASGVAAGGEPDGAGAGQSGVRVSFPDVNADGRVSAVDALMVINELNRAVPSQPAGELIMVETTSLAPPAEPEFGTSVSAPVADPTGIAPQPYRLRAGLPRATVMATDSVFAQSSANPVDDLSKSAPWWMPPRDAAEPWSWTLELENPQ